eukprot:TCONS_00020303-protein
MSRIKYKNFILSVVSLFLVAAFIFSGGDFHPKIKLQRIEIVSRERRYSFRRENATSVSNSIKLLEKDFQDRFQQLVENLQEDDESYKSLLKTTLDDYVTQKTCTPQQNIIFLKTHKTGSSTLTNILNRYADINNLRMLIPSGKQNRFDWPNKFTPFSADVRLLGPETKANMLVNHARFSKESMQQMISKPTKFITILRNPVTQFDSLFHYEGFDKLLSIQRKYRAMDIFLSSPKHYYQRLLRKRETPEALPLLRNSMLYDLGFTFHERPRGDDSDARVGKAIQEIDETFDMVLLMDYFDESLVLLMNELCWGFEDIIYMKHNVRAKRKNVSTKTADRIRKWNSADWELYKHFNKTFWNKIQKYGSAKFAKDLREFRERNNELVKNCQIKSEDTLPPFSTVKQYKLGGNVRQEYQSLCEKILLSEVEYLQRFRDQYELEFKKSSKNDSSRVQREILSRMQNLVPEF